MRLVKRTQNRTLGLLERGFLGPIMALAAFLVERRLVRAMRKRAVPR